MSFLLLFRSIPYDLDDRVIIIIRKLSNARIPIHDGFLSEHFNDLD